MAEIEIEGSATEVQGETGTGETSGGGSPHFSISDGPPGAEAAESVLDSQASSPAAKSVDVGGETAPPAAPFFTFKTADGSEKTFQNSDEANQFFSSWNGRLSKAERELRDAESKNLEWQRAYESGELIEYYNKTRGAGQSEKKTESKQASADDANFELMGRVNRPYLEQLLKEGKATKALEYIQYVNGQYFNEKLEAYKKELQGSIDAITAPAEYQRQVANSLTYIAESEYQTVNDMGEPRYPEFVDGPTYDKNFVIHFRNTWLSMPVDDAQDPRAFRLAYHEAKSTYRRPEPPKSETNVAPDATRAAAEMVRDANGRFAAKRQALAMSSEGSTSKPSMGSGSSRKGEDILTGMRNSAQPKNPHFSVTPD